MNTPQIGLIIKDIRQKKKLTQEELAEKSGITAANISKIENNKKDITSSTLNALLIALDLPPIEKLICKASTNGFKMELIWDGLSDDQKEKLESYAEYLLNGKKGKNEEV